MFSRPGTGWSQASKEFRAKNPLCLGCKAVGRFEVSVCVDHIVSHKGNEDLIWDQDNWQALCQWHHCSIKRKLETLFDYGLIDRSQLRLNSKLAKVATMEGLIAKGEITAPDGSGKLREAPVEDELLWAEVLEWH